MTLSLRLLIGVALVLASSVVFSNFLLKQQVEKTGLEKQQFKVVHQQPFRHLKIKNGNILGEIAISWGDSAHSVRLLEDFWLRERTKEQIANALFFTTINDTLFISLPDEYAQRLPTSQLHLLEISMPDLASIACESSSVDLRLRGKKQFEATATGFSDVKLNFENVENLNLMANERSQITVNAMEGKAKNVNARLFGNAKLDLRTLTDIGAFQFKGSDGASYELSQAALAKLMQKSTPQ